MALQENKLRFILKAINELKEYLGNQIENGANSKETLQHYKDGTTARDIIQKERLRLLKVKAKNLTKQFNKKQNT